MADKGGGATVMVGTAPPLEDVISGAYSEKPFDLASLSAYSKTHHCANFLKEVGNLRRETDPRKYKYQLLKTMTEYVEVNSKSEVNLSDRIRKETQHRVAAVLESLGKDDLTLTRFFSFPSPVNSAESRLNACVVTCLVPLACYLAWGGVPWLWAFVAYGFMARALFSLFVLRPLVVDKLGLLENKFIPGPPKRFAQLVGLMFSTTCMVLAFLERRLAMVIVAVLLFVASFLSGLFDTCPACVVFGIGVRFKVVPRSICEECSIRYIKGEDRCA